MTAKFVTRGLLALGLLAVVATFSIFSSSGAHVYPAADRSAPVLLGDRALGPHRNRLHAGQAHAFRMRAYSSGVTGGVHLYIDSQNTARAIAVGIYSDAQGRPGSLLSKGALASPKAHAWNIVPVTPTQLVSGRTYWLALLGEGGTLRYRGAGGGSCSSGSSARADLRALPERWGTGKLRMRTHCPISGYVLAASADPSVSSPASGGAASPSPQPAAPSSPADPKSPAEEAEKKKEEKAKEEKAKEEKAKEEKVKEGTSKNCFENPETEGTTRIEACGYPGPKDTAVENCAGLAKSSGSKTITTKNETIEDTDITGQVTVDVAGVTLNKDCIVYDGHEASGSSAVILDAAASDFTIANTTVRAENDAADSFEEAVSNDSNAAGATASKDRLEDCGECLHQAWALTNSYVIANGQRVTEETDKGEVHREDWYCNDNTITAEGNTMLNPDDQTAVIFCDTNLGGGGACSDHVTAVGNLIAGSGYMLYPCGNSSSVGTSTMTIKDNRFARCLGATKYESGPGGTACAAGPDANGYWPSGGYFGVATSYYTGAAQVWEGNYWDNDLEVAAP